MTFICSLLFVSTLAAGALPQAPAASAAPLQPATPLASHYALREAWIGKLRVGPIEAVLQFRIEANEVGQTRALFDSISDKRADLAAEWRSDGADLAFNVAEVGAEFRGRLNAARTQAVGHFRQGGRELPLSLERRTSAYASEYTWERRAQRPRAPFPYTEQALRFTNERDAVVLAGTLSIPRGAGPHPAVVLISGSGPQDRDETLFEHKPFLVLADYLSRHGIAVLRYDDRGTAESSGTFALATIEDFARDASAAVDCLRTHASIDPARIGLIGHSEGGLVAPLVATERSDVALIVLLAGPGVSGAQVVRAQSVDIARAEGAGEVELKLQQAVMNVVVSVVERAETAAGLEDEIQAAVAAFVATLPDDERALASAAAPTFRAQLGAFTTPWFRHFVRQDPRTVLRRVRCPVLALSGSKDVQVSPRINLPEIERALADGGNADHEVRELTGLNHMFQSCTSGAISEFLALPETLSPVALETIERWISQRVRN
jgi:pimeloyl-ACP methyl ester carboxylesterase